MIRTYDRKLVLPDGTEYYGFAFGGEPGTQAADGSFTGAQDADSASLPGCSILELVFNTSMAGYQEILSDPSYTGQAVVMSYPLIGNYGMAEEDYESDALRPGALIVREYNPRPSNFRSISSLGEVMREQGVPGLWGIDTRSLVRRLRTDGSMMAAVAVVGSTLSFPVFGSKCAPVQHLVNVLCAVFLGPWYGLAAAFIASLIRNLLGLGTLLAFPGSMCGAVLSGYLYRKLQALPAAYFGEVFGTSVIGGMLAFPIAKLVMGNAGAALFTFVVPFLISTAGGTLIAIVIVTAMRQTNVLGQLKTQIES